MSGGSGQFFFLRLGDWEISCSRRRLRTTPTEASSQAAASATPPEASGQSAASATPPEATATPPQASGQAAASAAAAGPACTASATPQEASGPPAASPQPASSSSSRVLGGAYYVIFESKHNRDLVGVHCCTWEELQNKLPGGRLHGSGCRNCKKFFIKDDAVSYFRENGGNGIECRIFE